MAKLTIDQVECVVMEGGGARGTAYYGAIRALQELMAKRARESDSGFSFYSETGEPTADNSILDYVDDKTKALHIKGVGGASAGAITTYALSLGLTAKDINDILENYAFDNFLSIKQKSIGKYRMVSEQLKPVIGEDDDKKLGRKTQPYVYSLSWDKMDVNGNAVKGIKRNFIGTLILRTLINGLTSTAENFLNGPIIRRIFGPVTRFWNTIARAVRWFGDVTFGLGDAAAFKLITWGLMRWKLKDPIKMDMDVIGNIVCDNGAFSGFAVRDFFFDMTIFALSKNTRFRRGLIEAVNSGRIKIDHVGKSLDEETLGSVVKDKFIIGQRSKAKFYGKMEPVIRFLETMTFRDYYEITGVKYVICAASFTNGFPCYFSVDTTPDFLVQEAAGASMTIPPAIKPVYNAGNVFNAYPVAPNGFREKLTVKASGKPEPSGNHPFVDVWGDFSREDYELFEFVVKRVLQDKIREDDKIGISTNNSLQTFAFLDKLRSLVVSNDDLELARLQAQTYPVTIEVEGEPVVYTVDHQLLTFFYNACYKGMFIDGGYRNNIPYNAFRTKEGTLPGVLAIKLDGDFPGDLMSEVNRKVGDLLRKEDEMMAYYDMKMEEWDGTMAFIRNLNEKDPTMLALDEDVVKTTRAIHERVRKVFEDYLIKDDQLDRKALKPEEYRALKKEKKLGDKAVKNLAKSVIQKYRKINNRKPWEIRHYVSEFIMGGYDFGSEEGQLRTASDHDHIIPIYDYGVTVYDFKMSEVKPMAALAQDKATNTVNKYFSGKSI